MRDEMNNNHNSESSRAGDERTTATLDPDHNSMASSETLNGESQNSEDFENSEDCVVQPSDVMTIQEVQDNSADLNLSVEEMQFLEGSVLYEFPKDVEDTIPYAVNDTDFFNPLYIAQNKFLRVKADPFVEHQEKESGKITEIKPCVIEQRKGSTVDKELPTDLSFKWQRVNAAAGYGSEEEHVNIPTSHNQYDTTYIDELASGQQDHDAAVHFSDEFADIEDNCDDVVLTGRNSNEATVMAEPDSKYCSDARRFTELEDTNLSGNEQMSEPRDKNIPITAGLAASRVDSITPKNPAATWPAIFSKYGDPEARRYQEHKFPHPVKRSKLNDGASCSYFSDLRATEDHQMNARKTGEKKPSFRAPMPAIIEIPEQKSQPTASTDPLKAKKKVSQKARCNECNVRLGLCAIRCRCGNFYCAKHRYDKEHSCTFDYKAMGAEEIRKNNPQVIAEKVRKL